MKVQNIARSALESSIYAMKGDLMLLASLALSTAYYSDRRWGKESIWRQIACDVMQLPLAVPMVSESAAFGAALQALWTVEGSRIVDLAKEHVLFDESKSCTPDKGAGEQYEVAYTRYQAYVEAMTPLFA